MFKVFIQKIQTQSEDAVMTTVMKAIWPVIDPTAFHDENVAATTILNMQQLSTRTPEKKLSQWQAALYFTHS